MAPDVQMKKSGVRPAADPEQISCLLPGPDHPDILFVKPAAVMKKQCVVKIRRKQPWIFCGIGSFLHVISLSLPYVSVSENGMSFLLFSGQLWTIE